MIKAESLYRSVSSIQVPGYVIDSFGEDRVSPAQTPFRDGFIPDFSRIVTSYSKSRATPELIQISPTQKRSFEVRYGKEGFIFWADEYGNMYGVLQIKGGNVIDPDVRVEDRAPSGFLIWGIQDSDSILRTVRASNLMRSHNIATETIVRLVEPAQLQFKGEMVSREEFKTRLIQQTYKSSYPKRTGVRLEDGGWQSAARKDVPKLAKELDEMTFYLSTLGRQISERFQDLIFVSPQDMQKVMSRVFTFWNSKQKWLISQGINEDEPEILDSSNPQDILKYFSVNLPQEVAKNYARLHNLGLVHVFPHLGNVSLVGSIYDLDSVYGEPLGIGDDKITDKDVREDVSFLLMGRTGWRLANGISELLGILRLVGIFPKDADVGRAFTKAFAIKYIEGRGWLENFKENIVRLDDILKICKINIALDKDQDIKTYLIGKVGQSNVGVLCSRQFWQQSF